MSAFGLFHAGDLDYAVPLAQIRKIVQGSMIFPLPLLPAGIDHVLIYESTLVPILLPGPSAGTLEHQPETECYVLVDSEYGLLAFVTQPNSRIVAEYKGSLARTCEGEMPWQVGIFHYQQQAFKVLDVDELAMGITRGHGSICLTLSGARRLNEEEAAAGR